ncbi:MAG: PHP domain-containing protein [Ktedonobacterales bacterium]
MPNEAAAPAASTIDLHTHSTASDGLYPPEVLVGLAHAAGVTTLGLADHDTTAGVPAALAAGERLGVRVIPAVEVNTDLAAGRGEAHVLGYFVDVEQPAFQSSLATLREARARRGERMVERLRALGFDITWERVRELAGGSVGRPHVARALIERGYATDVSEAFDRYLGPGRPGYIARYKLSPGDAVRLIRSARGVAVLAHPGAMKGLADEVLPSLLGAGLQGIECYYGQYPPEMVERLLRLADTHGLIATGGSDYHGPNMHPTPLGGRYVPPEAVEGLWVAAEQHRRLPPPAFTLPAPEQA